MNKPFIEFLIVSFAVSWACFGALVHGGKAFGHYLEHPAWLAVLGLGCLGPLAGAVFVHLRNVSYGGLRGLFERLKAPVSGKTWRLGAIFLTLHYGLAILLRLVVPVEEASRFVLYLLPALVFFGSQELGWRLVAQPELEKARGFWRSTLAAGLLWAVWFLPLLFVPGFVIHPSFFMQFAAYLAGASFLLTVLFKQGGGRDGGILPCVLFSTIFFAATAILPLKQTNAIALLALVDIAVAVIYQSKRFD